MYQVLNTTSHGGYHELFMGDMGSLEISEDARVGFFYPEVYAMTKVRRTTRLTLATSLPAGKSRQPVKLRDDSRKPVHMPHVENFFEAIRKGARLACPAEEAFATAVPILRTNDAVATGRRIVLTPADYEVSL